MTKYTTLGPKLAVLGLILAKLSLCLTFAAPKFHSWDLFWLFLVAKLITTHKQAWAICLKMSKNTILRPKLASFGLITAKLSLRLKFAAPQFHSWDLLWLFLAVELIKAREQAWASSFYSNFASFGAYLAKNEGHTSFFLDFWINFSVIFHQFGCIPLAQRTQNAFRKSKPVFLDIWKKTSFFGLFVAIFLKIAVKSWIFPPKSCFIKKHMSFRSKIWNQIKKVIFRKFEIVPLLRHCAPPSW